MTWIVSVVQTERESSVCMEWSGEPQCGGLRRVDGTKEVCNRSAKIDIALQRRDEEDELLIASSSTVDTFNLCSHGSERRVSWQTLTRDV